jgi:hypothetical protein
VKILLRRIKTVGVEMESPIVVHIFSEGKSNGHAVAVKEIIKTHNFVRKF